MKNKISILLAIVVMAFAVPATTTTFTGCTSKTTLEEGGVYHDPVLAVADRSILDSSKALSGFIEWANTNSEYLAKWPEIGVLAGKIAAQKDGWIKDAFAARDAYASAYAAYQAGKGDAKDADAKRAMLNGSLALLSNVIAQINAYKLNHKDV